MRNRLYRTPMEWFQEAARCYLEGHQACAWCGEAHQVFKSYRGTRLEYYCSGCDFYACHDDQNNCYHAVPGQADLKVGRLVISDCG